MPHHITQRGNRRQRTFFCDDDYQTYREIMGEWCAAHQVEIWAYSLVRVAPLLKLAPNWRGFLARVIREEDIKALRSHERTGRPLGDEAFLATLEQKLGRILRRQKPGPKLKPRGSRGQRGTRAN